MASNTDQYSESLLSFNTSTVTYDSIGNYQWDIYEDALSYGITEYPHSSFDSTVNGSPSLKFELNTYPLYTNHTFGGANFTIDFWALPITNRNLGNIIVGQILSVHSYPSYNKSFGIAIDTNSVNETQGIIYYVEINGPYYPSNLFVVDGNWHHFALTYDFLSTTLKGYVDGNYVSTINFEYQEQLSSILIGNFIGYIDEVHISKTIRWDSNFTPPTRWGEEYTPNSYLYYYKNGVKQIPLYENALSDDYIAIRKDANTILYSPLIDNASSIASPIKIMKNGKKYALMKGDTI